MRVLHLRRRIFAIPGIERRRALARVAEHERHLADGDDRETAGLIAGIDVSDVGDVVARHVVMVERLAELLRRKDRDLDRAVRRLGDIVRPFLGRLGQRVRGRNPERQPEVDLLVLGQRGDGGPDAKRPRARAPARRRIGKRPTGAAGSRRARSISACLLPEGSALLGLSDHLAGARADRQARARGRGRSGRRQTFLFFASQLRSRLAISAGLK